MEILFLRWRIFESWHVGGNDSEEREKMMTEERQEAVTGAAG